MESFNEFLKICLAMDYGNMVVGEGAVQQAIVTAFRGLPRTTRIIDTNAIHPSEAHDEILAAAAANELILVVANGRIPENIAHLAWKWMRGDGLVQRHSGIERRERETGFNLYCCLDVGAWMGIHPEIRRRLEHDLLSGGRWYPESLNLGRPLICIARRTIDRIPDLLQTLRTASGRPERRRLLRAHFPATDGAEGFEGHEQTIVPLFARIEGHEAGVKQDLLAIFVDEGDLYLAYKAIEAGWPVGYETQQALSRRILELPHLGGQRQYFWDLMERLIGLGDPGAKVVMERIVRERSIALEDALHVLAKVRLWPAVVGALKAGLPHLHDEVVIFEVKNVLRSAATQGGGGG